MLENVLTFFEKNALFRATVLDWFSEFTRGRHRFEDEDWSGYLAAAIATSETMQDSKMRHKLP